MITFDPLWKTLASKHMNKGDLQKLTGLSSSTIAKLSKGEDVMTSVVDRICEALQVPADDVMAHVSAGNGSEGETGSHTKLPVVVDGVPGEVKDVGMELYQRKNSYPTVNGETMFKKIL